MNNRFSPEMFFDLNTFSFKELFHNSKFVWDVLPKIGVYLKNYSDKNVVIGEGTVVEEGAYVKGPALIGRNSFIGHGAYIRENCIIGDNVHVGHAVEIKNSILLNNSIASHFNYIGDSIIGSRANVAAGAILANVRLDKKTVVIKSEKDRVDTGFKKFGSVVGDGSMVGVNAVLNPGTVLGKNCIVYPQTSVVGIYGEGSLIK